MIKNLRILLIGILALLTHGVLSALPQSPLNMDNDYSDWKGGTGGPAICFADEGGVDESNLNRADITEYCLHIDPDVSGGLYVLMAMDDTEPQNADVRMVVDVDGNQTPDYAVNNSLTSHPQNGLSIAGVSITECEDGVGCSLDDKDLICGGKSGIICTGATEGFNNNWPSQFTSISCDGVNCDTFDGFIEVFVPWQWLGGTPPNTYLFGLYFSAHSGGTEDTSADNTGQGVACNDTGCYVSGPTAVSLQSFFAVSENGMNVWPFFMMLVLSSAYLYWTRFK